MVQFQMKTSNRPETIAFVKNAEDIKSFRENPEWYEITSTEEQKPTVKVVNKQVKKTKENV